MRKWQKYLLDPSIKGKIYLERDETISDHAKAMGGYSPYESNANKTVFFNIFTTISQPPEFTITSSSAIAEVS